MPRSAAEARRPFDPGHPQLVALVPVGPAACLGLEVIRMVSPLRDGLLGIPVGHGDTEPRIVSYRFDTYVPGDLPSQLFHAFRRSLVGLVVALSPLAGEYHGPVGRVRAGRGVRHRLILGRAFAAAWRIIARESPPR